MEMAGQIFGLFRELEEQESSWLIAGRPGAVSSPGNLEKADLRIANIKTRGEALQGSTLMILKRVLPTL